MIIKVDSSKVIKQANGKQSITLSKNDWEKIGAEMGWMEADAKKKGKKVNPWAVCHTTVDKDKDPEKYERCVMDVKAKHPIKKD
jgi:hypothetical protein